MIRALLLLFCASPAVAQGVVAAATIRAGTVIAPEHLTMAAEAAPGALSDMRDAIGLEARVNLYADRPVRAEDLGAPTLVRRNERVSLVFVSGALRITAEGRALGRAGAGETVEVMNMGSRSVVLGVAVARGAVEVTR